MGVGGVDVEVGVGEGVDVGSGAGAGPGITTSFGVFGTTKITFFGSSTSGGTGNVGVADGCGAFGVAVFVGATVGDTLGAAVGETVGEGAGVAVGLGEEVVVGVGVGEAVALL